MIGVEMTRSEVKTLIELRARAGCKMNQEVTKLEVNIGPRSNHLDRNARSTAHIVIFYDYILYGDKWATPRSSPKERPLLPARVATYLQVSQRCCNLWLEFVHFNLVNCNYMFLSGWGWTSFRERTCYKRCTASRGRTDRYWWSE